MRRSVWPRWLEHGIDHAAGGFHEHLAPDGHGCDAPFRRLRVVTRQIVSFSAAAAEHVAGAAEAVRLGCDFLQRHAKQPEGGYAWRFDLAGNPIDYTRDLYDHAFALLAWACAAPLVPEGVAEALAIDAYLQVNFRHDVAGYVESLPASQPRRQNPHMHLLEAYLHAASAFDSEHFFGRARELVELFLNHLFQFAEGALPEYFDDDLRPLREAGRFIVEPGHHAEWIWLLRWYQELCQRFAVPEHPRVAPAITALADFLNQDACLTRFGALIDEIWSDGVARTSTARLWPQTERLKAELLVPSPSIARIRQAYQVLEQFTAAATPGLWCERWSPEQGFTPAAAPASSLYHLTMGILVAERALR